MISITLKLHYKSNGTGGTETEVKEFEVSANLEFDVEEYTGEWLGSVNAMLEDASDEWEYTGHEVQVYDDDFADPNDFDSLEDYAEYIEKCEEHGEAYVLRFEDIGENDFDDQYHGCHASEEDYTRDLFLECTEIPSRVACYIDWECVNRDMMMDHSSYQGAEGFHIFSD